MSSPPVAPARSRPGHLSDAELERYVLGALPADRAAVVEEHAAACARCAAALHREARLEVSLCQVARVEADRRAAAAVVPLRRRRRVAGAVALCVLAAAAGWLLVAKNGPAPPATSVPGRPHLSISGPVDDFARYRVLTTEAAWNDGHDEVIGRPRIQGTSIGVLPRP